MRDQFDIFIRRGTIVDGTGATPYCGSIGIKDGLITYIGKTDKKADVVLDASNCIVSPGFIDAHSNLSWGLFIDPYCRVAVYQGVTSAITGNCGSSVFPVTGATRNWIRKAGLEYGVEPHWQELKEYAKYLDRIAINIFPLVGHGTLRVAVSGFVGRSLYSDELVKLKTLIQKMLKQGAWGISFGLAYPPGIFADMNELIMCCKESSTLGKPCCFHLRIESDQIEDAVNEVIQLATHSGAACVICHRKVLGRANWGKTKQTINMINNACKKGHKIFLDMYPYTYVFRNVAMLLPDWAHEGGREQLLKRLADPCIIPDLIVGMQENIRKWDASWEDTVIIKAPFTPSLERMRLSEIIKERGEKGILEILLKNGGKLLTFYEGISQEDLIRIAKYSGTMVGTDCTAQHGDDIGHPRSFATFPKFLDDFVFKNQILSLEEAIWKMTGLTARVFRIIDRGVLKVGFKADICVFSINEIDYVANAKSPLTTPWPRHLVINGKIVIHNKKLTGELPGRCILSSL